MDRSCRLDVRRSIVTMQKNYEVGKKSRTKLALAALNKLLALTVFAVFGPLAALSVWFATLWLPSDALAQIRGRCVPTPPCYCSEECLRCGPGGCGSPGGSAPTIDHEAERRAREEADRQREENERRELERRKAEQQMQFEHDRDKTAESLKGNTSTGAFGLKGVAPADSGLRAPGERVDRDITGKQAAWKQLHCAASILGPAIAAITPPPGKEPDFTESRYLLNEALNALNGQRLGVQCSAAPPMPQASGQAPTLDRAIENQKKLIDRAHSAASQLEQATRARTQADDPIARAYAEQQAYQAAQEQRLAPIREQQRQINRERERKPGQPPAPSPEAQAKKELDEISKTVKKVQEGSQDFTVDFGDPPAPPQSRNAPVRR